MKGGKKSNSPLDFLGNLPKYCYLLSETIDSAPPLYYSENITTKKCKKGECMRRMQYKIMVCGGLLFLGVSSQYIKSADFGFEEIQRTNPAILK